MYINNPVIKGKKSPIRSKKNSRSNSKAKLRDQSYFENIMIKQVDELMLQCQKTLNKSKQFVEDLSHVQDDEAEDNAFQHCIKLLEEINEKEQQKHIKVQCVIKKKILQIEDYKQRLQGQEVQLQKNHMELSQQVRQYKEEIQEFDKKHSKNNTLKLELEAENQKIEGLNEKISQCKGKSRSQKDEYVELQTTQFTLEAEIQKEDEIFHQHEENFVYLSQYQKLKKLRDKIGKYDEKLKEEVTPHLQRKINKMAHLRTQLKHLTDALEEIQLKIEDQNYIIMGLKEKSYVIENDEQDDIFSQYKTKYQQIYFSQKSQQNSWIQYQEYLKNLLGKQKKLQNRIRTQFNEYSRNDDSFHELTHSSKKVTRERFHRKQSLKTNEKLKNEVKLPKLVQMQGKKQDKNLIKENLKEELKKQKKQKKGGQSSSEFEIMSLKSKDSRVSGEIIEVEFHQK